MVGTYLLQVLFVSSRDLALPIVIILRLLVSQKIFLLSEYTIQISTFLSYICFCPKKGIKYATVTCPGNIYSYMSVVSTLSRWAVITRALKGSGIITRPVGYRPPPRRTARLVAAWQPRTQPRVLFLCTSLCLCCY